MASATQDFPAAGHHRPLTGTKLYCSVTEAHVCEQLAQGCYLRVWTRTDDLSVASRPIQSRNHYTTKRTLSFLNGLIFGQTKSKLNETKRIENWRSELYS